MTIGNLFSKISQTLSMHTIILVAILPIPIKNRNIPQKQLHKQRQINREVLNEVLRRVLQLLTFTQHSSAESGYYKVLCADGNFSRCKRVLAARLADWPAYCDLYHRERDGCFWCQCQKNELGDYVHSDRQHPRRDHNRYWMLHNAHTKPGDPGLLYRPVHRGFNQVRHIPCIFSDLPKPDLLDTIQIGMLDHLQKWIFYCMKMHERLNKYNAIWSSVPAYHDLTPKTTSYEAVSEWNR